METAVKARLRAGKKPNARKIAIACQGGGSQTAFTAGVLKSFFENDVHRKHRIVSLTGTSGGAVCAALAWYGLLKAARGDSAPIQDRIMAFWDDLTARLPEETGLDKLLVQWLRVIDKGVLPRYEMSPSSMLGRWSFSWLASMLPRAEFTDFKGTLSKHIDFDDARACIGKDSPILLVGAANVLTGELKIFNSKADEISVEALLASAAVPNLFPAVQVGDGYYWDGLFSDNPPLKELIRPRIVGGESIPDEIWIIQINPTTCKTVPATEAEILNRRNEMIGNMSLLQSLEFISVINRMVEDRAITDEALTRLGVAKRDPVEVHFIRMSEAVQDGLDYVSKLSRDPSHIARLIDDGEKQGLEFLRSRRVAGALDQGPIAIAVARANNGRNLMKEKR